MPSWDTVGEHLRPSAIPAALGRLGSLVLVRVDSDLRQNHCVVRFRPPSESLCCRNHPHCHSNASSCTLAKTANNRSTCAPEKGTSAAGGRARHATHMLDHDCSSSGSTSSTPPPLVRLDSDLRQNHCVVKAIHISIRMPMPASSCTLAKTANNRSTCAPEKDTSAAGRRARHIGLGK